MTFNDTQEWAQKQWGEAELGDARRTSRAVSLGAALAARPDASLPTQTGTWAALKAAYLLLAQEKVTQSALLAPHYRNVAEQACQGASPDAPVLWIQDTTNLDYSSQPHIRGLGPIGNGAGRGFLAHNCLVVRPASAPQPNSANSADSANSVNGELEIVGLGRQTLWARGESHEGGQDRLARLARSGTGEGEIWRETLEAVGAVPPQACWVSVCDRGSDVFSFLSALKPLGWHAVVRICQNRRIEGPDGESVLFKDWARTLEAGTTQEITLRGRAGEPKRRAKLSVAWARCTIQAPLQGPERHQEPVEGWCVRCWEANPPASAPASASGEIKPIEWILFSTLPVLDAQAACERVQWYSHRWLIEEYHKCLKTGCRLEERQLHEASSLQALAVFLSLVALRLLQLRTWSRESPDQRAETVVEGACLRLVAAQCGRAPAEMTMAQFWNAVARLGGFIGRKSDGNPGWQTLWKGWLRLQDMCWAVGTLQQSR